MSKREGNNCINRVHLELSSFLFGEEKNPTLYWQLVQQIYNNEGENAHIAKCSQQKYY